MSHTFKHTDHNTGKVTTITGSRVYRSYKSIKREAKRRRRDARLLEALAR